MKCRYAGVFEDVPHELVGRVDDLRSVVRVGRCCEQWQFEGGLQQPSQEGQSVTTEGGRKNPYQLVLAFAPGAGVCALPIADTRHHAYAPRDDWELKWYPYTRHIFQPGIVERAHALLLLPRGVLVRVRGARDEGRVLAVALDEAGESDRRLQGMGRRRGSLRHLWVHKLRAWVDERRPASLEG